MGACEILQLLQSQEKTTGEAHICDPFLTCEREQCGWYRCLDGRYRQGQDTDDRMRQKIWSCLPLRKKREGEPLIHCLWARFHDHSHHLTRQDPWDECDREQRMIQAAVDRGEPFYLADSTDKAWFGGKVHFCLKITYDMTVKYELERARLGTSDQLTRSLGSHAIIRAHIDKCFQNKDSLREVLQKILLRPFVVGGHVYRAFSVKDQTVRFIITDEAVLHPRDGVPYRIVPQKLSESFRDLYRGRDFITFTTWYNSLELNSGQVSRLYTKIRTAYLR